MSPILIAIAVLGAIGLVSAALLYVVSRFFHVEEDPRIAQVEACLPGANCGGCGRAGCHDFAVALCSATSLDGMRCPGAGTEGMEAIASLLGMKATAGEPMVAVLKCNGTCESRPRPLFYDGAPSCAVAALTGAGEGLCPDGCLGCGDCVEACSWDALHINSETGLPVIDTDKCTGCGVCVSKCPRRVIELRPVGRRGLRVWVACSNTERGPAARKSCRAACIGCTRCVKECKFEAVTVSNNLAWIDPAKCRLCRKCADVCPAKAIHTANFPVKKADQPCQE